MKKKQQMIHDGRDTNTAVKTLSLQVTRSFSKMKSAQPHSLMQSLIDQASCNISNATAKPIHEPSSQQPQHMFPSSPLTSSRTDGVTGSDELTLSFVTIIPDANGLQEICHRLHERKECVAIPTECTYEMIQPFQHCTAPTLLSSTSKPLQKRPYYVYIPNVSIFDTCPFWKHVLPKKAYAIRKEPTSTTAIVSTFNESVHVLRRLSTKCWPGPILIYVQVPHVMDGLTVTVHATAGATGPNYYTNESNVQHYIAIRKPCHPLSRKVCTEYYKQQLQCRHTTTSAGTNTATISGSSTHSSCSTTPSASPMFLSLTTPETPRVSSISSRLSWQLPPPPFMLTPCLRVESNASLDASASFSSLPGPDEDGATNMPSSSLCDNNTKPRPGHCTISIPESKSISTPESKSKQKPHLPFLLVGTPMMKDGNTNQKMKTSSSSTSSFGGDYVRSADEAVAALLLRQNHNVERKSHNVERAVSAVLHGEERYEILSVPTCMYREPYPTSIWIDSTNRIVRIKNTMNHHDDDDDDVAVDNDHVALTPHALQRRVMSPQSTMTRSNSFLSLQQEKPYMIDETSVVQALRAVVRHGRHSSSSPVTTTSPTAPLSSKERVLHAVLLKWKVVTENESCSN